MKRGFYTIMSAQFFSSLADNALFVAAVELLRQNQAPDWQGAALVPIFALFYVLLAPLVGAVADALPKGRVMFFSNMLKVAGCSMMLFGTPPLLAYAVVGLGAAAYSPAKYGILTELLPPSQLVKANGWIEGLTIASILLGVLLGGLLIGDRFTDFVFSHNLPWDRMSIHFGADAAIAVLIVVYLLAAVFNLHIPSTGVAMRPIQKDLVDDFLDCNRRLWQDKLGQITLATTTLFWGVSGNLKFIVLAWAGLVLGFGTAQATSLLGVVAIGTAAGATWASFKARLDEAEKVIPLGIVLGLLVIVMNAIYWVPQTPLQLFAWQTDLRVAVAAVFLLILGGVGGYLVVPMNALLQHRGHNLMGAGRSIAVQNFNEQLCILVLGGLYVGMEWGGLNSITAIIIFGVAVVAVMLYIARWYARNMRLHTAEMQTLLALARDSH